MSIQSDIEYKGELIIEKILLDGTRQKLLHKKNLVVTIGKNYGVSRLISNSANAVLTAIGVGSGTTAPAITDVGLGTQLARQAFDANPTQSANTVSMTTTFAAGVGTGTWGEAGLFWATGTATGVMFSRTTFTAIPKGAADTIAVTWNVTAS
jgi:hypothetical protein